MKNEPNTCLKECFLLILVGCILLIGCSGPESQVQLLKDKGKHALDSIRNEVLRSYNDTVRIDTAVIEKGDTIKVKFRHYCTYDKKISTPREYLDIYKLSEFITHNFVSEIEFKINSKIVYKGLITKHDFNGSLSDDQKKYGVLNYHRPDISISGKTISIEYGIGIPISGRELGYEMEIDSTGKKQTGSMD
ncbi:hypothetical protein [Mucilaginibacter sp.]|uniref:hypothetical protein n=1 Tax=Mucilaginibacter sp. TaxID=1882438 RepID=UPI00284FACD6|nr:hypothetical protein [Mucilaginibacter sp.]MDR3695142.1 hypothetical protein [Mucilaginibacter sp.]